MFTGMGPIYHEYGSLIITFDSTKSASRAVSILQESEVVGQGEKKRKLIAYCLPNIQVEDRSRLESGEDGVPGVRLVGVLCAWLLAAFKLSGINPFFGLRHGHQFLVTRLRNARCRDYHKVGGWNGY